MFTGIVSEIGTVRDLERTSWALRLSIAARDTRKGLGKGDSVAVNGVCLTAVTITSDGFTVDVVPESLRRTTLGSLTGGDMVDLERPVSSPGRFDGHVVQGHVDGVGLVAAAVTEGDATRLRVEIPADLARYVVEKGSIALDGVSLTVAAVAGTQVRKPWFEAALIPYTLEATVLGMRRPGDQVNIEVDVMAKYVERLMEARR